MISDIDRTLEALFKLEFGTTLPFDLSFAIPDKTFRTVSGTRNTLNCYLYDIRENRELRSVAPRLKRTADGMVERVFAPVRVKLSYCITAWSPAQPGPGTAPALYEHALLGDVLAVLLKYPELPSQVLAGRLVAQEPHLPTAVIAPDGPKNTADFWNAIGGQLRPSLDYNVTLALAYQPPTTGPIATGARTAVGVQEDAGRMLPIADGGFFTIGGTVRAGSSFEGVGSAWVRIDETGKTCVTDTEGRFVIDRIAAGTYTLAVRAVGFQQGGRSVQVPQPDGLYDVTIIPLA